MELDLRPLPPPPLQCCCCRCKRGSCSSHSHDIVQDGLLHLPWPPKLLSVPQTAFVYMGDVSDDPSSKGQGPPIMAGLRVRIGINT
eukprot:966050-Pelagomonas_calceolata.AAC.4